MKPDELEKNEPKTLKEVVELAHKTGKPVTIPKHIMDDFNDKVARLVHPEIERLRRWRIESENSWIILD